MTISTNLAGFLICAALAAGAGQAAAAEPIVIFSDQSQILNMPRPPGTVVVGNPSIADVTVQGQQVFLHARSYGTTNIIILDEAGAQLANYEVTVQLGGSANVALYKAGQSYSYVCAPDCEAILHVGDQEEWFKKYIHPETVLKSALATGQKPGEASASAPAE